MVQLQESPAADQPQQQKHESEPQQQQPVVRSNKSAELVRELRRRYLEEYEKHKYDGEFHCVVGYSFSFPFHAVTCVVNKALVTVVVLLLFLLFVCFLPNA